MTLRMPPGQHFHRGADFAVFFPAGSAQQHPRASLPTSGTNTPCATSNPRPPMSPILSNARLPNSGSPFMTSFGQSRPAPSDVSRHSTVPRAERQHSVFQQAASSQRRSQSSDGSTRGRTQQNDRISDPSTSPRLSSCYPSMLQDFQMEVDVLTNACESNVSALMEGPQFQLQEPRAHSLVRSKTGETISDALTRSDTRDRHVTLDELRCAMSPLERTLEEQHKLQKEQLSTLMTQWEKRFSILEKAVTSGLKLTTSTASTMNERSSKFLRFGQALEGVVDKVVRDGKGLSQISETVEKLRVDVDRLGLDIRDERAERRKDFSELLNLRGSGLLPLHDGVAKTADSGNQNGASDATERHGSEATSGCQLDAKSLWVLKDLRSEVSRLTDDLSRKSTDLRQLFRTVQSTSLETVSLREQQDAMHKQMLKLSREPLGRKDENSEECALNMDNTSCDGRVNLLANAYKRQLSSGGPEEGSDLRKGASPKGWGSTGGARRRASSLRGQPTKKMPDTILEEECFGSLFAETKPGKETSDISD